MADTGRAAVLRVEVLGPLRVVVDGAPVEVPGPKRRAVLALLALAEGRTVSVDRLVDALWPGEMPDSGRQALHTHVSRLRTHLGPAASRLQTRHGGYRLDLAADELDLAQARTLLRDGPRRPGRRPRRAAGGARAVARPGARRPHRRRTDRGRGGGLRAAAPRGRRRPGLLCRRRGPGGDVVALAAAAHADDPLREPAVLLLMRVLAATGQAPEALPDRPGVPATAGRRDGSRPVAGTGRAGTRHRRGAAVPATPPGRPRPPDRTRLIGREAQVAALHRLLAERSGW